MASVARAKAACKALPGVTSDIKWGSDLVYSVGGKMFAVVGPSATISFKVDDERFLELTDRAGFVPAPYLARAHWVLLRDFSGVGDAELKALLRRSWELVFAKLTRAARAKIEA
jgi:predicted DNA-binding protein (MmcQ/YjbR family)